jgi:hypothetical protein
LGHRRSLDEIHTILAYKDDRFDRQACQDLHKRGSTTPWDSSIHFLGLRSRVHLRLLLSIQHTLETRLDMSIVFHPQTDGQSERVIQVLEDLLWACVLEFEGN